MPTPRRLALIPLFFLTVFIFLPALSYASTATSTSLQVTPACLTQGCVTTLTATVVAGSAAVHPGLVYFCEGTAATCDNGAPIGQAQLLVNGTATIKRALSTGVHHLHAVFLGTAIYSKSSSPIQELTVAASANTGTITRIFSSNETLPLGEFSYSAAVTSLGPVAPTGTVSFRDTSYGNSVLATAELGAGTASRFTFDPGGLDFSQIPGTILATASRPVAGDFNNDGFQDILVLDQSGLHVLLGSSIGKFTQAPKGANNLPTVVGSIVVADFNSDGKLDIAFSDANAKTIHLSFGNGDGTFTDAKSTVLSNIPGQLYLGDFNNDGIPDLIANVQTAASQNSTPVYELQPLLGKGDGTFNAPALLNPNGTPLLVADFDRDGKLDVLVETAPPPNSYYGSFLVLHGNGDGTFTPLSTTSPNFGIQNIVAGDFNADGIPDLVTYDGALLAYWQGAGDGTFAELTNENTLDLDATPLSSLIVGDFDGDGVLDVGGLQIDYTQQTNPTYFTAFLRFSTNPDPPIFSQVVSTPPLPNNANDVVVTDFNSDGLADVVQFNPGTVPPAPATYTGNFTSVARSGASSVFSLTPGGPHNIVASYPGDDAHAGSVSAPVTLTAPQIADASGFTSSNGLALNGGVSIQNGALQLTDGKTFEARSAFANTRVPVYNFATSFNFQIPGGNADGFAFVVQSNGPNAVGSSGGALGYGQAPGATAGPSITNSLAVVFDLHNNQGEGANSVRLETGGVTSPAGSIDLTGQIDLHSGHHFGVQITGTEYDQLIQVAITDLDTKGIFNAFFQTNYYKVIGDTFGYVGFTSGTGATASTVNILNWSFAGSACCTNSNIPSNSGPTLSNGFTNAASQLELNRGAAISGSALQLTNGSNFEATSAYFKIQVEPAANEWTSDFDFTIAGTGGDGFTFVTQGQGLNAVGTSGGGLGYGPYFPGEVGYSVSDSAAVKFDLHNNAGEGNNSTGFYLNGAPPTVPAIDLTPSRIDLHSGHTFHARLYLDYFGDTLHLSITDLTDYAVFETTFPDSYTFNPAYIGFTAGTGATSNTISILNWTWAYSDVNP